MARAAPNQGSGTPEGSSRESPEGDGSSDGSAQSKDETEAIEPLPLDIVFDMLKNERRREALGYIRSQDGPFTLSELAEHIAALENDKEVAALNSTERKRVYVGLYQCHLPRMADAGVIEFDRHRGTIRDGSNSEQLYPYLDVENNSNDSVRVYAGIIGVFGIGLVAGILASPLYLTIIVPLFLLLLGGYALMEGVYIPEF